MRKLLVKIHDWLHVHLYGEMELDFEKLRNEKKQSQDLINETVKFIDRKSKEYYEKDSYHNFYAGDIPEDWKRRVDELIAELEENARASGKD